MRPTRKHAQSITHELGSTPIESAHLPIIAINFTRAVLSTAISRAIYRWLLRRLDDFNKGRYDFNKGRLTGGYCASDRRY